MFFFSVDTTLLLSSPDNLSLDDDPYSSSLSATDPSEIYVDKARTGI